MDISAIIYAAIGGGLGGLIGALIAKALGKPGVNRNINTAITTALVIAGYTATTTLYKNMTLPRLLPSELADLDADIPTLKYIREDNPKMYAELIYPLDRMMRQNEITPERLNEFREQYQVILTEKRKIASVDVLRLENEIAGEQLLILREALPITCTQKFHGRPYGQIDDIVGTDYQDKENAALAKYFTQPPRPEGYVPDVERGKASFDDMINTLAIAYSVEDFDPVISDAVQNKVEHQKICDLTIGIGRDLNAMNDDEFLDVYVYLQGL